MCLIPEAEGKRPADINLSQWGLGGRDAALDTCVVSLLQQAKLDIEFCALAVETIGAWEEGAANNIDRVAECLARASGQDKGVYKTYVLQTLNHPIESKCQHDAEWGLSSCRW